MSNDSDPFTMSTVTACIDPTPATKRSEGNGEGVDFKGEYYYYIVGKRIPKDKVVSVKSETNFMGRQRGDLHFLVLAWNGQSFSVLDTVMFYGVRKALAPFRGLSPAKAIEVRQKELDRMRSDHDARPRCVTCGKQGTIRLDEGHMENECFSCFRTRTAKKG